MLRLPGGFREVREDDDRTWILRDGFPVSPQAEVWEAWLSGRGEVLDQKGGRAPVLVARVEGVGGVVIRRYFHGGLLAVITRHILWGTRRPLQELAVSEAVRSRGVSTPEILALHLRAVRGPFYRACLVTRQIRDGENLRQWVGEEPWRPARARPVLREVARAVAVLHGSGCLHGDLNLANLLRTSAGITILDLDRAKLTSGIRIRDRGANLLRLYRSLRKETGRDEPLPAWERLLFLKHYVAGDGRLLRPLAAWLDRRWALQRLRRPFPRS